MRTLATIIGLLLIAATVAFGASKLGVGQPAPSFELKTQFDKTVRLSDLKGRVTVLVAATKESGELMGPWVDNLKSSYSGRKDDVAILGLIDLHTIARLFRGFAISTIKKETKDPLLIDFDGRTAKAYEVSDNYPVVVVIDKDLVVRNIQKTEYDKDAFGAVTSAVDKALKETSPT